MRRVVTSLAVPAVVLVGAVVLGPDSGRSAPETPAPVAAKLELLRERLPVPYGAPDRAHRHATAKRLPLDRTVDTRAAYARAERHARGMRLYSSADGRHLTVAEARAVRDGGNLIRGKWRSLGPGNVGGRTRTLVIDPGDPNVLYAGGVSGGVWKSIDGGTSWNPSGTEMQNIAVNSMAMRPGDGSTLVVGTGEGYFREDVRGTGLPLRGGGIFMTQDGGRNWNRLESTTGEDFWFVNDLVYSPDGERLYAATRTGVFRSADAGQSWDRIHVAVANGGCLDLAIRNDASDDILFAACGTFDQATVFRSGDAATGEAFDAVLNEPGMGRTSLAIAPSDQGVIYALAASNEPGTYEQALHAVYRSDDGGVGGSWVATVRNTDSNAHNTWLLHNAVLQTVEECGFGGTNLVLPMGWYVNAIAVDPFNPDIVWVGGVDWFRSADGGRNFGPASFWWAGGASPAPSYTHADQHGITFDPGYDGVGNQRMYISNDGGVWRSDNARAVVATGATALCDPANSQVRYTSLNNDLGITQFYHGLPFPNGRGYIGGTQDNGTRLRAPGQGPNGWQSVFGGDGGYVAVDPRDPDVLYFESQNGNLARSNDGGASAISATRGLPPGNGQFLDPGGNFVFVTPFVMAPDEPDVLWIGGRRMYRTVDGARNWSEASRPLRGRATAVAVAPSDSGRIAAGTELGFVHITDEGDTADGRTSWPRRRPRQAWVSWVAFDPFDADVVYATYAGFGGAHVFRSDDGGRRWQSIDGRGADGLPDIPVHALVVDPLAPERLFIGTDLGVFATTDGGASWAQENAGFGNIVTESLHLQMEGTKRMLYAFTHGRGAWRVPLRD